MISKNLPERLLCSPPCAGGDKGSLCLFNALVANLTSLWAVNRQHIVVNVLKGVMVKPADLGRHLSEVVKADHYEFISPHIDRCFLTGKIVEYKTEINKVSGKILRARLFPVKENGTIEYVLVTGIDLTDEFASWKQMSQRYAEERNLRALRERQLIEFTVPNPQSFELLAEQLADQMQALRGSIEIITTTADVPSKLVKNIFTELKSCEKTVQELATPPSRAPSPKAFAISPLLKMKTIRCLQKDIPQNINFQYDLSALAIYKTAIPPHILTPLIQRLILNGVEAIGEELGEISVTGAFQDGAVTIFVRNTGKLPKKNMPKLFVAFWTTKPNHLGVGLYNARRVLRRYDASLRYLPAESGTCFAMTLPVIDDAPSAKIIPLRIGGNERVLYIDDEYESCEKLKALIHQFGYDTSTATHVEDALIRIASGDEYDVIVLNAANPSMPCGAFLRELAGLGYKGKVVLVDDPRLSPAAETVLIAAQIPRPYSILKLVRTIRQVIDGERRQQHEPNHIVL